MTRIIPIGPSIPGEPKVPDNTRRAKSARQYLESQLLSFFFSKLLFKIKKRQVLLSLHKNVLGQLPFLSNNDQNNTIDQYPESQKRQTISGEPKVPDNTQRAKSATQYPESQKRQTIPGEPITLFFFKIALKIKKQASITQFT